LELAVGPAFEASFHNLSLNEVFEGIIKGVRNAEEKYHIKVNLITGPTFKWKERKAYSPLQVFEETLQFKEKVVGFGLSAETKEGIPFSNWNEELRKEYTKLAIEAKEAGFGLTVHAGEVGTAQSVIDAIQYLKADRIGHGIKCTENLNVLKRVIKERIPLEICISSNVKSGIVKNLHEHPVRRLHNYGIAITINTDDPTLCNTSLTKEYEILTRIFRFSHQELKKLTFNALSASFLNEKEKSRLERSLQKYFVKLEEDR